MTLPTKAQIKALNDRIEKVSKLDVGLSSEEVEKQICNILRSAIRKTWMRHPIKLLAIDLVTEADMNPATRTVWKVKCARCGKYHRKNEVEVDHMKGEHSLKTLDDLAPFALSILNVTTADLQALCKPCHRIKTYSERNGCTEEFAEKRIRVIDWVKKNSVAKQKAYFKKLGYEEKAYSNGEKREGLAFKELNKKIKN